MRLAAQHVMLPRAGGGLNGEVCNRVVILSVVHVLETFQCKGMVGVWCGLWGNVVFLDSRY